MKYVIIDDTNDDLTLYTTYDKHDAESALLRWIYLGYDAYLMEYEEPPPSYL